MVILKSIKAIHNYLCNI